MWQWIKKLFKGKKQERKQEQRAHQKQQGGVVHLYPSRPVPQQYEPPARPRRKVELLGAKEWLKSCREVDAYYKRIHRVTT